MMIKKDSDYDYSMKSIPPLTKLDIVLKSMISETSFIRRLFRLQRKRYPKLNAKMRSVLLISYKWGVRGKV